MEFVYPGFLWALTLLAIPVIIHLFYFRRRKKVFFTNVRFLKEIKEETDARRNIKRWLILVLRLLALTCIILAFAQPFISKNENTSLGRKAVSIFIDNSFSMSALSEDVPLIERAKTRAREIINGYSEDDQFQILSHELSGRQQRMLSKEEALLSIDELTIVPDVSNLSTVVSRQESSLISNDLDGKAAYIISDFQQSIADLQVQIDSAIDYSLVPLSSVQENNLSIDSAWFEAPLQMKNQPNPLVVTVRNLGSEDVENIRLSLQYQNEEKPVGTLDIPAGEKVNDTINITPTDHGWQSATLKITDYPIVFDDAYFLSFHVPEKIKVLVVSDDKVNTFLESGLKSIPAFDLTLNRSGNINYSDLPNYQFIILQEIDKYTSGLNSEMEEFVRNGGNLLIFPNADAAIPELNTLLIRLSASSIRQFDRRERKVVSLNREEFVFRDVFENQRGITRMPTSSGNFVRNSARPNEEVLMRYRDGSPYLSKYALENGNLYFSFAPLSEAYNNLLTNGEIMIPMLYKMAISAAKNNKISYTIGQDEVLESSVKSFANEQIYEFKGKKEFIPGQVNIGSSILLSINEQIKEAGEYNLVLGDELINRFSFNFNRQESQMQFYSSQDLDDRYGYIFNVLDVKNIQNLSNYIQESSQGRSFWKLCIIFALIFLLLESLVLRFWKA